MGHFCGEVGDFSCVVAYGETLFVFVEAYSLFFLSSDVILKRIINYFLRKLLITESKSRYFFTNDIISTSSSFGSRINQSEKSFISSQNLIKSVFVVVVVETFQFDVLLFQFHFFPSEDPLDVHAL